MTRRITPDMPREVALRIAREESGDIKARWMLIDLAEAAFFDGDKERKRAAASLIHAYHYLSDREEYTANPWPKNKIQLPAGRCRHSRADELTAKERAGRGR